MSEVQKSGVFARLQVHDDAGALLGTAIRPLFSPNEPRHHLHYCIGRTATWSSAVFSGEQDWALVRRYASPEPVASVASMDQQLRPSP